MLIGWLESSLITVLLGRTQGRGSERSGLSETHPPGCSLSSGAQELRAAGSPRVGAGAGGRSGDTPRMALDLNICSLTAYEWNQKTYVAN